MQRDQIKTICLTFTVLGSSLSACAHHDGNITPETRPIIASPLKTDVISSQNAKASQDAWGTFLSYYEGRSNHITDILTGVAIINPGEEIHPPHKHPEEEFLMILEGQGTWSIKGVESPASAGDILFAVPGDLHGIKNTGDSPLKFVVFKYNPKP